MPISRARSSKLAAATIFTIAAFLFACDDDSGLVNTPQIIFPPEIGIIVNSTDVSVTLFAVDTPGVTRSIGLNPGGAGSPATIAARENLAIVPLGLFPAAAIVDLLTDSVRSVPLPSNSGATGVAFLNDSIAYVANSNLNTVSVINTFTATAGAEIPVGIFPQAIVTRNNRDEVYVLTAQLENFVPARPGRISIIDANTNTVTDSIILSGLNPAAAVFGSDGLLYVINSGNFAQGNGSLSVVNVGTRQEVEHHEGFGEFPGDIAYGPMGRVHVSAFAYGIAVWDAVADSFIRPPADPVVIDGNSSSSGVGFDSVDRLYSLIPGDCLNPSLAYRLNDDYSIDTDIQAGGCPFAVTFTKTFTGAFTRLSR